MRNSEFKKWRERLGITQEVAAIDLGVSRPTIVRYELHLWSIPRSIKLSCDYLELAYNLANSYLPYASEKQLSPRRFPEIFRSRRFKMYKSDRQCGCAVKLNQTNLCPSCANGIKKWIEWKILNKKLMDKRDAWRTDICKQSAP